MPVNGKVIPHTPLAVDFWQVRKCPGTRLFFLSHMHSDHTSGLTSTWSNRPIYCSPTTATLLSLKLQVKQQWIHPLEMNEPHMLSLDDINKEKLTVTLIDANHCPGAVMFLFEGYFGSILYTGDFRYTPSMLREPCLRNNTTIDVLYLDNTNCDPNRTIPSRQRATQQIKEIIRTHPNHNVVIGLYALGKESLLVELAMEFKTWVEVTFERMETLRALELPDVFSTDPGAGRIRVVDQTQISAAALQRWSKEQPTLAILPTSRPLVSFHPSLHVVPYSDHSSYQELEDFVCALKPTSLVPIVGNHVPGSFAAILPNKKRHHDVLVPESVKHFMMDHENPLGTAAFTSLCRRYFRPLPPKGVVFESPLKESRMLSLQPMSLEQDGSEDEMDTESSEMDSDCVLGDLSKDRRGGDTWSLDLFQPVPEDSQRGLATASTRACLSPATATTRPADTDAGTASDAASSDGSREQHRLSAGDAASPHTETETVQDDEVTSSVATPQRLHRPQSLHRPRRALSSHAVLKQADVEKLEDIILKDLPFTEEDFQMCSLPVQSALLPGRAAIKWKKQAQPGDIN